MFFLESQYNFETKVVHLELQLVSAQTMFRLRELGITEKSTE